MTLRGRPRWTAALASAAVLLALLVPMRLEPRGARGHALGGVGHVLAWAGLAWVAGRNLSPSRRGWRSWLGLAAFAGLAEGLQSLTGRTPEWTDWFYGAGGAAIVCATWGRGGLLRWGGVLALAAVPFVWQCALERQEVRAFPDLARPGNRWADHGWEFNGVKLVSSSGEGFKLAPVPDLKPGNYPGLFRAPACRDWRGLCRLETAIYWPGAAPAVFAVRVDDRSGNPSYADRFQREFGVAQGWNAVAIAAAEFARTPGGRPLRLDDVRQWGVFLVSDVSFDYFLLGPVGLVMQEECP